MDFSGKHVVVTGGTGALGTAVVGRLLAAGATCTVPYVHEAEAQRFPHRGDPNVTLIAVSDLADEAAVAKVYAGLQRLGPRSTSPAASRRARSPTPTRRR